MIVTARSNKGATILGIQDFSQLRKDYGKEQADEIVNICGNNIKPGAIEYYEAAEQKKTGAIFQYGVKKSKIFW